MDFEDLAEEFEEAMKVISLETGRRVLKLNNSKKEFSELFKKIAKNATPVSGVAFKCKMFKGIKHKFTANLNINTNFPFSVEGCKKSAGRFHLKNDCPTLYFASSPDVVTAELGGKDLDLPTTTWPIDIKIQNCLNITSESLARESRIFLPLAMKFEWKEFNDVVSIKSYSQRLGRKIAHSGYEGMLVPSARKENGQILVVFPENLIAGSSLRLYGDPARIEKEERILVVNQSVIGTK